ncbi:hypothetical protein ACFSFY_12510 [Sporosarcina siberiensis]|uniref:Uncharacterized protein n=1 Tax=Sporosarcina siberiensis TaxID=1365606 RepID=A0ABW4SJ29_9BACL
MFRADIDIKGKHAAYIKQLVDDYKIFALNLDVYMSSALIGYINGRKEDIDISEEFSDVVSKIGTQALLKKEIELDLIYRLIMLLDNTKNSTLEEQINRAFRADSHSSLKELHKENMSVFNSYVRGGITVLYEELIRDSTVREDQFKNIHDFVKGLDDDFNLVVEELAERELKSVLDA